MPEIVNQRSVSFLKILQYKFVQSTTVPKFWSYIKAGPFKGIKQTSVRNTVIFYRKNLNYLQAILSHYTIHTFRRIPGIAFIIWLLTVAEQMSVYISW